MYNMFGWGFGGGFMMFFIWIVAIVMIVLVVKLLTVGAGERCQTHAEEILRERFAKGEITKKEFDEKTRVLQGE